MLPDAEDIETRAIRAHDLLQQVAHPLGGANPVTRARGRGVYDEAVDADLHAGTWKGWSAAQEAGHFGTTLPAPRRHTRR